MLLPFNTSVQNSTIAHLDNDNNDKMISGHTNGEIVAWDFTIGF